MPGRASTRTSRRRCCNLLEDIDQASWWEGERARKHVVCVEGFLDANSLHILRVFAGKEQK